MITALVIDLKHILLDGLQSIAGLRLQYVPDVQAGLARLQHTPLELVICTATTEQSFPGGLVKTGLKDCPAFRGAVLVIHWAKPMAGLDIFTWQAAKESFGKRVAPLNAFRDEVRAICERQELQAAELQAMKQLGFNNCVQEASRSWQVQTEVVGRRELTMRTMVIENGAVLDTIKGLFPSPLPDLTAATRLVEEQHQHAMERVRRGDYR